MQKMLEKQSKGGAVDAFLDRQTLELYPTYDTAVIFLFCDLKVSPCL